MGADLKGIDVGLPGGVGNVKKPWDKISTKAFLQLSEHFLNGRNNLPKEKRADTLVSVAYYCYANGGFDPAAKYARTASELDPNLVGNIDKLMPDIIASQKP